MKKKLLALGLVAALSATAVIGGTLAYFTDTDAKSNVFTVGNVEIELNEEQWEENAASDGSYKDPVYPGQPLAKDPTVTNTGDNPCYVRIKVEGLSQFVPEGATEDQASGTITLKHYDGSNLEDGYNDDDWELYDGYYYYMQELAAEASTSALFDQIVLPVEIENEASASPVVVTAEAVQSQGAASDVLSSAANLAGWFDTCMGTSAGTGSGE